jgi:hypothetical protein
MCWHLLVLTRLPVLAEVRIHLRSSWRMTLGERSPVQPVAASIGVTTPDMGES